MTTRRIKNNNEDEEETSNKRPRKIDLVENNILGSSSSSLSSSLFCVRVSKETFKFNAAHFVAYKGFREPLHGHNYSVSVKLIGSNQICHDGYVLDYGDVKKITRQICKELSDHFLCPMYSDVLQISVINNDEETKETESTIDICKKKQKNQKSVSIVCEDGSKFLFPYEDCIMLPIVHATTEELAVYIWQRVLHGLDPNILRQRAIQTLEITVAEAPGQEATFQRNIQPEDILFETSSTVNENNSNATQLSSSLDVRNFINGETLERNAKPCTSFNEKKNIEVHLGGVKIIRTTNVEAAGTTTTTPSSVETQDTLFKNGTCCNMCKTKFSNALQKIADSINNGELANKQQKRIDVKDLVNVIVKK